MPFGTVISAHPRFRTTSVLREAERALDLAQRLGQRNTQQADSGFVPRIQAVENESGFVITAELPGVEPADLAVSVEEGVLTLKGERKAPGWSEEASADEKAKLSTAFTRRIRFNGEIDEEAVSAKYRNGLLTVTVPKRVPPAPEVRTIPVEVAN
jgi:HSP20 family protein